MRPTSSLCRRALLVALTLILASPAHGAVVRVLVDGSGSMKGYFAGGDLARLVGSIRDGAKRLNLGAQVNVFSTSRDQPLAWTPWDDWSRQGNDAAWGNETRLDEALGAAAEGARLVVMITDNFQDAGADTGSASLYTAMRTMGLRKVYFVPALLSFDGNVDLYPGDEVPTQASRDDPAKLQALLLQKTPEVFRQGGEIGVPRWVPSTPVSYWKVPYRGRRGLAIYVASAVEAPPGGPVDALADTVAKATGEDQPMVVHPLGEGALSLEPAPKDTTLDKEALACGQTMPDSPPNLTLVEATDAESGTIYHLRQSATDDAEVSFDPRQPTEWTFALQLRAADPHVEIVQPERSCRAATRVELSPVSVEQRGSGGILLPQAQATGSVAPQHVLGALARRGQRSEALWVTVRLPPLVGSEVSARHFDDALSVAFDVVLRVPRPSLHLAPSSTNRYFTDTTTDLARIYSPTDVVQSLAQAGEIEIRLPVELHPDVPMPPPPPCEGITCVAPTTWASLFGALLLLFVMYRVVRPLGFDAPIYVDANGRAYPVTIPGSLNKKAVALNVGGSQVVALRRASWWGRRLDVHSEDHGLRQRIAPGQSLRHEGERLLEYCTGARAADLKRRGLYVPR